jgi:chlorite dismutase
MIRLLDRIGSLSPREIVVVTAAISVGIISISALVSKLQENPESAGIPGRFKRLAEALLRNAGGRGQPSKVHMPIVPPPELREVGAPDSSTGERQFMNRRLYMQLRVLDIDLSKIEFSAFIDRLKALLKVDTLPSVLYSDTVSNNAIGILTWGDDPSDFVTKLNPILAHETIGPNCVERKGWTMFGKTYSNGHEKDLEEFLFKKPIRNATRDDWEWAIWYPLRRRGPFYIQPPQDQCSMLLTHAAIGKAFSDLNAAHDIRLKCFGMDPNDNEYVVGLVGDNFHGLSRVVEEMRKTRHTAEYIESLGPFFVGRRIWVSSGSFAQPATN